MLPLTKVPPFFPGQWGIPGSDSPLGIRVHPDANVYYVDNSATLANVANDGTDPLYPLTTLAAAIAKCTANRGDVIIVGEGHAENVATAGAITVNRNGVSIIGLGRGTVRPTFTLSAVAGSVIISAPNVKIENILFSAGAAATIMVDVNSTDFSIVNCEFRESAAARWVTAIDINGGGANACDRTKVIGCTFKSLTAGATQAIEIGAVQDSLQIVGNWIVGDFSVAGVHSGSVCTNMLIANNFIINNNAADFCIELTAAATGMLIGNRMYADAVATILDPGSLKCLDNIATSSIDASGMPIPTAAAWGLPSGSITDTSFDTLGLSAVALGKMVERTTGALPQTNTMNLFQVTGRVRLVSLIGTVTTNIGAVANATKLLFEATDICATSDVNNDQVGVRYNITGTFANAMVKSTLLVPVASQATPLTLPAGMLKVNCAGNDGGGGRVQWTLVYIPLSSGASVVAV